MLHQNLTAQVKNRGLIRISRIGFIDKLARGGEVALLKSLLGLFQSRTSKSFCLGGAFRWRGQLQGRARLPRLLLEPANFVQRFSEELIQLRRKIFLPRRYPVPCFLCVLALQGDGGVGVMDRRCPGREFELRQNGINHVLLTLEQVSQENLVLDQLSSIALQFRHIIREQILEAVACFDPIFLQERNFSEIEPRVPKFGINPQRFVQCCFGIVVDTFPHQDDAAEILRFREIRLSRVDSIELFERF